MSVAFDPYTHPCSDEKGKAVHIKHPHTPTPPDSWDDSGAIATFVPGGKYPNWLSGVALQKAMANDSDYLRLAEALDFHEPKYCCPVGLKPAAGVVIVEADRRVWVVHPSNGFAGYICTFPKGHAEKSGLRIGAVREAHEESGLLVEPFGYLADSKRSETFTRYYLARRVGGAPTAMGWESQAVSLVPLNQALAQLNRSVDHAVAQALLARQKEWTTWFRDEAEVG